MPNVDFDNKIFGGENRGKGYSEVGVTELNIHHP